MKSSVGGIVNPKSKPRHAKAKTPWGLVITVGVVAFFVGFFAGHL